MNAQRLDRNSVSSARWLSVKSHERTVAQVTQRRNALIFIAQGVGVYV